MSQSDKATVEVHKFGGTSLADAACYRRVASWVAAQSSAQLYVVASASAGVTDCLEGLYADALSGGAVDDDLLQLLQQQQRLYSELLSEGDAEDGPMADHEVLLQILKSAGQFEQGRSAFLAYGELWSSRLLAALIEQSGRRSRWLDARQVIRLRDRQDNRSVDLRHGRDQILKFTACTERAAIVLPGFVASTADGGVVTLGRDGSDYSAAVIAALVHAPELTIWTDVSGIRTADPAAFPDAELCPELSYREAALLAASGGNVLHPDTLSPLLRRGTTVHVRNSLAPFEKGSRIAREVVDSQRIRSLAVCADRLAIQVVGRSAKCWLKLREAFEHLRAPVICGNAGNDAHWVVIRPRDLTAIAQLLNSPANGGPWRVNTSAHVAAVTLVGNPALGLQVERALHPAGLALIDKFATEGGAGACLLTPPLDGRPVAELCYNALLARPRVNLAVIGCGQVGRAFLQQLSALGHCQPRVTALINTRGCLRSRAGLDAASAADYLATTRNEADLPALLSWLARLPGKTIILDVTADDEVAAMHEAWLQQGFDVITANKGALAQPLKKYRQLQQASVRGGRYAYETTVGAALPVIDTAQALIRSGQQIVRLEAVLSGSLSWLLNDYQLETSFRSRLEQAMQLGLCEPDPRLDLSGEDVVRKVLILARELGLPLERRQVRIEPLIDDTPGVSLSQWWRCFDQIEQAMRHKLEQARALDGVLRYVARIEQGSARIGLEVVASDHPIARLRGADNMVCFYTAAYAQQPLVIQGAGAGPEQTASGLISDLVRFAEQPRPVRDWVEAA